MGLLAKRKEDQDKERAGDLLKRELPIDDFMSRLVRMNKRPDANEDIPQCESDK